MHIKEALTFWYCFGKIILYNICTFFIPIWNIFRLYNQNSSTQGLIICLVLKGGDEEEEGLVTSAWPATVDTVVVLARLAVLSFDVLRILWIYF